MRTVLLSIWYTWLHWKSIFSFEKLFSTFIIFSKNRFLEPVLKNRQTLVTRYENFARYQKVFCSLYSCVTSFAGIPRSDIVCDDCFWRAIEDYFSDDAKEMASIALPLKFLTQDLEQCEKHTDDHPHSTLLLPLLLPVLGYEKTSSFP